MEGNSKQQPARVSRSPVHSLERCHKFLEMLYEQAGIGPFDRNTLAKALGHQAVSGPASSKIGAMVQFALLAKAKGAYRVSDVGQKLISPVDIAERERAFVEVLSTPEMYGDLLQRYAGQPLPPLLPNILQREYGLDKKQAERAVDNFKESAEFAGLLRSGILHANPRITDLDKADMETAPSARPKDALANPVAVTMNSTALSDSESETHREFVIPLNREATRTAVLRLPVPITSADLSRLRKWISFQEDETEEE